MRLSLILNTLLLLLAVMSADAEEISTPYKGLTVTANLETVGDDWSSKPVVVITHGTLAHDRMEIIQGLQNALKERGYSSLAINLSLGVSARTGMYDCTVPHTHRHTDTIDEIGSWLDWLKSKGVSSVVLLGHSRGGNQTAWFAAEHDSPLVNSVVLIAPMTWSAQYTADDYKKRFHQPLGPQLAKAEKLVHNGQGATLMKGVGFLYCDKSSVSAEAFVSYYKNDMRMDTPALLGKITKPVLVIAGSEDNVVTGLREKVQPQVNDHITLQVVEGADHFFRDLYLEEAADAAVAFIRAH